MLSSCCDKRSSTIFARFVGSTGTLSPARHEEPKDKGHDESKIAVQSACATD